MRFLNRRIMTPLKKEFLTLKSLIENINIEIVRDSFPSIASNVLDQMAIEESYRRGEPLFSSRYDIKINGIYHFRFKTKLGERCSGCSL